MNREATLEPGRDMEVPAIEVLTYRSYRARETLREWERRRSAYEQAGRVVFPTAPLAERGIVCLRTALTFVTREISRTIR